MAIEIAVGIFWMENSNLSGKADASHTHSIYPKLVYKKYSSGSVSDALKDFVTNNSDFEIGMIGLTSDVTGMPKSGWWNLILFGGYFGDGIPVLAQHTWTDYMYSVRVNKSDFTMGTWRLLIQDPNIGTIYSSGQKTLSSLKAQTQTDVASLTLSAGTYIVKAAIQTTSTPSDAQIDVTIDGLSCSNCNKKQSVVAKSSNVYNGVTMYVNITSSTTLKTTIWSSVALSNTIYGELSAIWIA